MPDRSLQDLLDETPDPVAHFYNETAAPHFSKAKASVTASYIPPEFTNWRDEQRAWRETAILFDQSHHMPELFLEGPDALRLLDRLGINSLTNFSTDRAKQFVACTPRGHVIGDCIVYRHGETSFELVSGATLLSWVQYQAEMESYDVTIRRDAQTPANPTGRRVKYRFQLDGPNAGKIFGEVVDGESPEIPFFRTAHVQIGGCDVLVLRHGMAGHQGAELSGPYDEMDAVRNAILEAGQRHGLRQGGTRAYFSTLFESGWLPYPCPGIYTGEDIRGFREWLPADGWEASLQLGGSFYRSDIEKYYVTPYELGYGRLVKFDHDFIGREALEQMKKAPGRSKMTLVWNERDVLKVFASQFGEGPRYKALEFPVANYSFWHYDEVHDLDGNLVGLSCRCGYSGNERAMLSLAILNETHLKPGTEVVLTWGEPDGGSRKPHVERHEQVQVRAIVAPAPYAASVRKMKEATLAPGR